MNFHVKYLPKKLSHNESASTYGGASSIQYQEEDARSRYLKKKQYAQLVQDINTSAYQQ